MERTREFKGYFHVLHGAISPMEGIGPDDIRIAELLKRLGTNGAGTYFGYQSEY